MSRSYHGFNASFNELHRRDEFRTERGQYSLQYARVVHALADTPAQKNPRRARRLYRRARDAGQPSSCYEIRANAGDAGEALALFERACAAKEGAACFNLGALYWTRRDVDKDEARAIEHFGAAGDAGIAAACGNLSKACEAGLKNACRPRCRALGRCGRLG